MAERIFAVARRLSEMTTRSVSAPSRTRLDSDTRATHEYVEAHYSALERLEAPHACY